MKLLEYESGFNQYSTRQFEYRLGGQKVHTQIATKRHERQSCMTIKTYQRKLVELVVYQEAADQLVVYAYFESILATLKISSIVLVTTNLKIS